MSEMKFDPVTGQPINQPAAQPGPQPGPQPGMPGMQQPNMQQPVVNGPKFDPVTGKPVQPGPQPGMPGMQQPNMQQPAGGPKFNPVTGQPMQPGPQPGMPGMQQPNMQGRPAGGPKFDPVTGQPIQMQRVQQPMNGGMKFDPKTGRPMQGGMPGMQPGMPGGMPPVNGGNNKGGKNKGLIAGLVVAAILILGVGGFALANASKKQKPEEIEIPVVEASVEATVEEEQPEIQEEEIAATEATSEEVVEEEKEETIVAKEDKDVDSSDMFAFNFDGTDYQLPMPIETLIKDGWSYNDDSDATQLLAAGEKEYIYLHVPGDSSYNKISVHVKNFSLDAQELGKCYVCEIEFSDHSLAKLGKKVTIHGGDLEVGKSTSAQVKAVYGEPDHETDSSSTHAYTYYPDHDDYSIDQCLRVHFEDDAISILVIENAVEPTDFEQAEVTTEKPAYLSQYKAPKELGNDPLSGNFELDGKLYTLPAPFQEFLDDGWSYGNDNVAVGAGQKYMVTLTKGKQRIYVDTVNLMDKAVYLENTIVVNVNAYNSSYSGADLKLPGGLTISTNDDNIKVILNSNNITNYTYKKDSKIYKIPLDQKETSDYPKNYISINMDDDGSISSLELQNYGWLLEE